MKAADVALLVLAVVCMAVGVLLLSAVWIGTPDLGAGTW